MYKKIASNTISQVVSKILTAAISIVLIGILTKTLSLELYGTYNKVFSYLGIFAFLADLGLYTIAVREIARQPELKEKIIGNILTLRIGLGIIIWILAYILALFLPGYNDVFTLVSIFIIGAFTLISLINSSLLALMQSQMRIEFSLISVVSGKILNIALVAGFLLWYFAENTVSLYAFASIFIAATCGILLTTIMNYLYAKKICSIRLLCDTTYIFHIFKISLPYGIALFLSVVYFKIDIILLSLLEVPQKADISIALYGLPMKIIEVLMILGGFYLNSLLPKLSQNVSEKKSHDNRQLIGFSIKILGSLGILIFLLGNLFGREIISILATEEYLNPSGHMYNSLQALRMSLGVLLFHFLALVFIYLLIAHNKQSLLLQINACIALINIVGNIFFIPHYSFIGAAGVTLASQAILMLVCMGVTMKYSPQKIVYHIGNLGISIILALLLAIGTIYIKNIFPLGDWGNILIFGTIVAVAYLLGEYMCSKKMINEFRSRSGEY